MTTTITRIENIDAPDSIYEATLANGARADWCHPVLRRRIDFLVAQITRNQFDEAPVIGTQVGDIYYPTFGRQEVVGVSRDGQTVRIRRLILTAEQRARVAEQPDCYDTWVPVNRLVNGFSVARCAAQELNWILFYVGKGDNLRKCEELANGVNYPYIDRLIEPSMYPLSILDDLKSKCAALYGVAA